MIRLTQYKQRLNITQAYHNILYTKQPTQSKHHSPQKTLLSPSDFPPPQLYLLQKNQPAGEQKVFHPPKSH